MLSISAGPLVFTPLRLLFFIAFGIALLVGWLYGRGERVTIEPVLTKMLLWGLVSARLAFVLMYLGDYWREPWRIVDIRDGGLLLEAGIAVAMLIGLYHAWQRPPIRSTLGIAVASGMLFWGGSALALQALQSSRPSAEMLPLTTLSGQPESLAQLRGRPLVVNLWATWCPPCRREMPVFAEAQRREQDIEFVFINQGESTATVTKFLHREQLELKNVYLDVQSEWSVQLGADAMPTTLFFDEQGVLVDSHTGELSAASLKQALKRHSQPLKQ